jgi:hypothetical protein
MKSILLGAGSNPNFSLQRRHLALLGAAAEAGAIHNHFFLTHVYKH